MVRKLPVNMREKILSKGIDAPLNLRRSAGLFLERAPFHAAVVSRDLSRVALVCAADEADAARMGPFVLGDVLGAVVPISDGVGVCVLDTLAPASGAARVTQSFLPGEPPRSLASKAAILSLKAMSGSERAAALWSRVRLPRGHVDVALLWDEARASGRWRTGRFRRSGSLFARLATRQRGVASNDDLSKAEAVFDAMEPSQKRAFARGCALARRIDWVVMSGQMSHWAAFAMACDDLPIALVADATGESVLVAEQRRALVRRAMSLISADPFRTYALCLDPLDAYVALGGIIAQGHRTTAVQDPFRSDTVFHRIGGSSGLESFRFFAIDARSGRIRIAFVRCRSESEAEKLFSRCGFDGRTVGNLDLVLSGVGDVLSLSEGGMSMSGVKAQRAWNETMRAPRQPRPPKEAKPKKSQGRSVGVFDQVSSGFVGWNRSKRWPNAGFESEYDEVDPKDGGGFS